MKKCKMFDCYLNQTEKRRLGFALKSNPGHAYLFTGPQGIGRKTTARIFAAALLCADPRDGEPCGECLHCRYIRQNNHPDYSEILPDEEGRIIPVDEIRQRVQVDLQLLPQLASRKVFLIAADYLNEHGQNALLKSLEEPPASVVFLLTALSTDHVLKTIVSRTVVWPVARRRPEEIERILAMNGVESSSLTPFYITYAQGVPGVAVALSRSEWFAAFRDETISFFCSFMRMDLAQLLTDGYAFLADNRTHFEQLLDLLASFMRDLIILNIPDQTDKLINRDKTDLLKEIITQQNDLHTLPQRLIQAHQAIIAARRGLAANASFEGLACRLLLALRKELHYA